nr:hypothetical protein [Candidatus Woesearchaeota archaeon]
MSLLISLVIVALIIVVLELASYVLVRSTRKRFQWLITKKDDEIPLIDKEALEKTKYFEKGFDSELGWVRKPNTTGNDTIFYQKDDGDWDYRKAPWTINKRSSRNNQDLENLNDKLISCYGDSFTFSRQVNDNETWCYYLSKLTKSNVLNWGIGNHGMDQALLRLEREFPKNKTKIVIMANVPDTISRVVSYWKHFYEYGNVWAFKPRYELDVNKQLRLVPNLIDKPEKFYELEKYIDELKKHDYFYKEKFLKDLIKFPYSFHVLKNPRRNLSIIYKVAKQTVMKKFSQKYKVMEPMDSDAMLVIRRINLLWAVRLYNEAYAVDLMERLVDRFLDLSKELKFKPVFVFLPQKNEALYYKNEGEFYMPFFKKISEKIDTIDVTTPIINHPDIDSLYSEKTVYGAHISNEGNQFVAKIIYGALKEKKLI